MTPTTLGMITAGMEKAAKVALVRRMAQGLLSPQAVQRAAGAMQPGKFRFVKNLGRGQYSLADEVVGNVNGYAGRMARKLPTRQGITPTDEYGPIKSVSDHVNKLYQKAVPGTAPPIAPFIDVSGRGGFQQLATGHIPELAHYREAVGRGLRSEMLPQLRAPLDQLDDLHQGNMGPGGQIIDFQPRGHMLRELKSPFPASMESFNPLIAPYDYRHPKVRSDFDLLGGKQFKELLDDPYYRNYMPPQLRDENLWNKMYNSSNNNVRKHWANPEAAPQYSPQPVPYKAPRPKLAPPSAPRPMPPSHMFRPTTDIRPMPPSHMCRPPTTARTWFPGSYR
jgi:hypothetical protein